MASKGMIFLENTNKIIEEALTERIMEGRRDQGFTELNVADFDDVSFKFTADNSNIALHIRVPNYNQLKGYGVENYLREELAGLISTPDQTYDVAVTVDAERLARPKEEVVAKFSQLRNIVQGAPLMRAFDELAFKRGDTAPTTPLMRYDYRRTESLFVVPQKDRVVVVYSLDFGDDTDQAMARVFLQEFVETQRTVNGAPVCSFSRVPPLELKDLNLGIRKPVTKRNAAGVESVEEGIAGYLSFALFPSHVSTPEKRAKAVAMLTGFRAYLHYHIKASKTYLHMRMRLRVQNLLQVLNRAIPEVETEKKTISGKSFKRAT